MSLILFESLAPSSKAAQLELHAWLGSQSFIFSAVSRCPHRPLTDMHFVFLDAWFSQTLHTALFLHESGNKKAARDV